MKTPVGRSARNKSRKNVGAPLWVNPDGSVQSGDGGAVTFKAGAFANAVFYAPYGKGNFGTYMREIVAGLIKEFVLTIIVCFLLPGFVSIGAGPDPVSRAIFIGLIAALSVLAALEWGYNERLPRFLTPGAQITAFLSGDINLWLLIAELVVGFAGATVAAAFLYGTGASAIPIIGTPNNNDLAGTFFVQLLFTIIIAYTVLDQKTTRGGYPRTFGKWPKPENKTENLVSTPENPTPNRVYHEGFARRPYVYAAVVWLLVAFAFLKFGLWSFNAYIYYAGALALVFLGQGGAFTNQNAGVGSYVAGAGALFIMVDVLAWILAMLIDWFMYWLHNNEYARSNNPDDDSSYGMVVTNTTPVKSEYQIIEDEYTTTKNVNVRNRNKKNIGSNSSNGNLNEPLIPIEDHLNSSHWVAE